MLVALSFYNKLKAKREEDVEATKAKLSLTGRSLSIFNSDNRCRIALGKIISSERFDYVILVLIFISSILLTLENPLNDPDGTLMRTLEVLDWIVTSLFILEFVLKVAVYGFMFNGKNSYIRNGWNIMDFIIVCLSVKKSLQNTNNHTKVISLSLTDNSMNYFKALRMFRVLRPIRMISRNEGLRVISKTKTNPSHTPTSPTPPPSLLTTCFRFQCIL
jgi:hypothetical protein